MILKPLIDIDLFSSLAEPVLGVFGSKKWLSAYGNNLTIVGIFQDDNKLIGGFYFVKTRKYGFTFVKLPPYSPHCGLFFLSENKNKSSKNNFYKDVLNEVTSYISDIGSALTVLAFPSEIIDLQPFIWQKFKVVPNYTYRIDLEKTIESIVGNFDPKNRNAINKAVKEEVTTLENSLEKKDLFEFFVKSLERTEANIYSGELKNIFFKFSDPSNSFSIEAKKDNKLLGSVFCAYDQSTCYYLLGGVNKISGIQGVNNLLVQKSIEKAMKLGCKVFDFEGSMLKGVEKFFRGFGAEIVPYYTVNKAKIPIEMILKFKKRELF